VRDRLIKWSYSGLKDFTNCPRAYNEVKVLRNYAKPTTDKMLYGTAVHEAFESYGRDGVPLPEFYKRYQSQIDALMEIPGDQYFEYKMALDETKKPCDFDAPEYWVRGICDLLVVDGDTAYIIDYKTGNPKYADTRQLKLMAVMVFAQFPDVKKINAALLFVGKRGFFPEEYDISELDNLWAVFAADLFKLKNAFATGHWPAISSGLCGYCPVKTCEHHGSGSWRRY
jgi:hypothetical protein